MALIANSLQRGGVAQQRWGRAPPAAAAAAPRVAPLLPARQRRCRCADSGNGAAGVAVKTAAAPAGGKLQAPAAEAAAALRVPDWPGGVHTVRMEVRDTELDQFSVVNNNKYGEFMQHGRHKALESMGAGVGEYQRRGVLMALSELNIKFKAPLRSGDTFRVDTTVQQVTAARLVMRQAVVQEAPGGGNGSNGDGNGGGNGALCAEGLATVVFLDTAYRPVRLPAADRAVFDALQRAAAGGD